MDNDFKIEKLSSGDQWSCWKFQIMVVLKASDLWDIVNGEEKIPIKTEDQTDAVFKTIMVPWQKKDSKAQRIIVVAMSQETMIHIINCKYASEMWDKLESVFEQKSKTSAHLLYQRFYSFQREPQDNVAMHVSKLEKIVKQLKDMGETVSDSMVITKILMTLPKQFDHFFSAWESTDSDQQTLTNLITRLMMEESRMDTSNSVECSEAFYVKKKATYQKNNFKKNAKEQSKCFLYKQGGHWKAQCPMRKPQQNFSEKFKRNDNKGDAFVSEVLNTNSSMDAEES